MFTFKSLRRLVVTTAVALATTGLVLTMPLSAAARGGRRRPRSLRRTRRRTLSGTRLRDSTRLCRNSWPLPCGRPRSLARWPLEPRVPRRAARLVVGRRRRVVLLPERDISLPAVLVLLSERRRVLPVRLGVSRGLDAGDSAVDAIRVGELRALLWPRSAWAAAHTSSPSAPSFTRVRTAAPTCSSRP